VGTCGSGFDLTYPSGRVPTNGAGDVDGSIDLNWRTITENTAKEEVTTSTAASNRGTEVRGIGV
jgi:hypothetical protein